MIIKIARQITKKCFTNPLISIYNMRNEKRTKYVRLLFIFNPSFAYSRALKMPLQKYSKLLIKPTWVNIIKGISKESLIEIVYIFVLAKINIREFN